MSEERVGMFRTGFLMMVIGMIIGSAFWFGTGNPAMLALAAPTFLPGFLIAYTAWRDDRARRRHDE